MSLHFLPLFSMHLGFFPVPSSFSCNHLPDLFDPFPFISPHVPDRRGQHPLHRLHHPKQCPPWMLNCCTLLQSFFHSSPFPPIPTFCSSTPLHFHQFCILFVHPFSSPFHPAISHELFIRIPFPFRSRCPVLHVLPVHFPASRFLRAIPLTFISFTSSHSCFLAFPLQLLVSHRQHACQHHPGIMRMMLCMLAMRGMLGMLSPKSGQFCRKRAT